MIEYILSSFGSNVKMLNSGIVGSKDIAGLVIIDVVKVKGPHSAAKVWDHPDTEYVIACPPTW